MTLAGVGSREQSNRSHLDVKLTKVRGVKKGDHGNKMFSLDFKNSRITSRLGG